MARPVRVNRANGWYRAYARGLNRMELYADERDRRHFLLSLYVQLEAVRDHIAIGGAAFVKAVKQTVQAGVPRKSGSKRAWRARVTIEEIFAAVARVRGQPWEQIVARHGDFGRPMAMWMARRFTGLTLRPIGDACGNRDYAATAMAIRRFQSRLENEKPLAGQTRELSNMPHVKMSPQ